MRNQFEYLPTFSWFICTAWCVGIFPPFRHKLHPLQEPLKAHYIVGCFRSPKWLFGHVSYCITFDISYSCYMVIDWYDFMEQNHENIDWSCNCHWLVVSTHLKNTSQNGNLPQIGVKINNIWNQHLGHLPTFNQRYSLEMQQRGLPLKKILQAGPLSPILINGVTWVAPIKWPKNQWVSWGWYFTPTKSGVVVGAAFWSPRSSPMGH